MRPKPTGAIRQRLARISVALLLVALCAPLAAAGEDGAARSNTMRGPHATASSGRFSLARAEVRTGGSFYRSHLLPRLNGQFRGMVPHEALPGQGAELAQYPLFDRLSENARQNVETGTRKALEDFLLEATSLDSLLDRLGNKAQDSPLRSRKRAGGFGFGVGISHCAPSVELSQRFGSKAFRASLGLLGVVRLEYRQGRQSRAWIYAGYDARDGDFGIGGRFRF
jgi:hypothetical protein